MIGYDSVGCVYCVHYVYCMYWCVGIVHEYCMYCPLDIYCVCLYVSKLTFVLPAANDDVASALLAVVTAHVHLYGN